MAEIRHVKRSTWRFRIRMLWHWIQEAGVRSCRARPRMAHRPPRAAARRRLARRRSAARADSRAAGLLVRELLRARRRAVSCALRTLARALAASGGRADSAPRRADVGDPAPVAGTRAARRGRTTGF